MKEKIEEMRLKLMLAVLTINQSEMSWWIRVCRPVPATSMDTHNGSDDD
jgi:hypothetical protein